MVVNTDAVADPWAVMVHSGNTLAADRAVMGTGWPETLAFSAVAPDCKLILAKKEFIFRSLLYRSILMILQIVDSLLESRQIADIDRSVRRSSLC